MSSAPVFATCGGGGGGGKGGVVPNAKPADTFRVSGKTLAPGKTPPNDSSVSLLMELLRRQFYTYEQYDAVRAMEMKEAREDQMFASLHSDVAFADLTKDAKNASMIGREFCAPYPLIPLTAAPSPRMTN